TVSYSADDISKYRQQMINYAIQQVKDANEDPIETQAVIATLQSQESMFQRPKRRTIFKLLQKCFSLEEQLLQEMVDQGEISSRTSP
ncbi:sodium:proton antiporter, partial [Pediococcus acidilactici]